MVKEVEYYLENILKNQLDKLGVFNNQIILDNVRKQIYSLLFHWNDKELRDTILLIGLEEGNFYLPNANDLVKSFVVVAIRNSYIESAGSKYYQKYFFESQIEDKDMRIITSGAIQYFKELDLSFLATQIKLSIEEDYYMGIIKKYPDSYAILKLLASMNKNEMYFEKLQISKYSNIFLQGVDTSGDRERITIEDGYSDIIGLNLLRALQSYMEYQIPFITCSFKHITRNFEKLLKVIQFILEQDIPLVSCNYYISNGYLSRRSKLIRIPHTDKEMEVSIRNVTGLSKRHAKAINDARKDGRI